MCYLHENERRKKEKKEIFFGLGKTLPEKWGYNYEEAYTYKFPPISICFNPQKMYSTLCEM